MNKSYKVFKRVRILHSISEVEELIEGIDKYGLTVIKIGDGQHYKSLEAYKLENKYHGLQGSIIIKLSDTKLEITSSYGKELCKPTTYIFDLNEESSIALSGIKCFAEFSKYYKIPKAVDYNDYDLNRRFNEECGKYICSAKPILNYNEAYNKTVLHDCYEYDLNSAYFSVILNKIPDLYKMYKNCRVKKNQVGFLLDDTLSLVEQEGVYADYVFDLIDCPDELKEYCKKWYGKKELARINDDKDAKEEAKAYLNLPIGYAQRYNPFFRSYVVNKCNKYIRSLIDDDTLFWNTDAIFTKNKRTDLDIGSKIGQFKETYCETLKYKENVYQINDDIPVYRGINKKWFEAFEIEYGRTFDILTDKCPQKNNIYNFNWETLKLEENEIWQKN